MVKNDYMFEMACKTFSGRNVMVCTCSHMCTVDIAYIWHICMALQLLRPQLGGSGRGICKQADGATHIAPAACYGTGTCPYHMAEVVVRQILVARRREC
jgi:hypothetical protein